MRIAQRLLTPALGTALVTQMATGAFEVQTSARPDVQAIVERSVQATDRDWTAAPRFDFTERDRVPGGTVTYRVRMISGTPYYYKILKNRKPLPPGEARKEQLRLRNEIAVRRAESSSDRAKRIAGYRKDRKRDHLLMSQLTKAFDFTFLREEKLASHRTWVLKATPRAGYAPPDLETEVLKGMRGTLWIDMDTYQWVKVEAHVVRPVSIAGFLARVEPGTEFELDKGPVASGIWLPRKFVMKSRAKVLFVFSRNSNVDETYFGYHLSNSLLKEPAATPHLP